MSTKKGELNGHRHLFSVTKKKKGGGVLKTVLGESAHMRDSKSSRFPKEG